MKTHTLTSKDGKYTITLREPLFDDYVMAAAELMLPSGRTSVAKAGKSIIETCAIDGDFEEVKKENAKYMFYFSMKAYELIEDIDIEVKKN